VVLGGAPFKRERSGICKIPLTGKRNSKYGGRKSPFPRRRKKMVDEKVVPFVKLVGPMESPRREDKENGLTFSDRCTWWTKRRREVSAVVVLREKKKVLHAKKKEELCGPFLIF